MAGASWAILPSVLIVEIFSYLSQKDRLRVATVCKRWRSCLFHPSLWPKLSLNLRRNQRGKVKFLSDVCGRFVREIDIKFDSRQLDEVKECFRILNILTANKNLQVLQLEPSSSHIEWPENITCKRFVKRLEEIIHTSRKLKHFSVGCSEELLAYSQSLLNHLSQHQSDSLEGLHLASVKEDSEYYGIIDLDVGQLCRFSNLKHLSIDYDYVDNNFLETLAANHRSNLQTLCIHITGIEPAHEKITNATWRHLVSRNKNLEVTINLLHSFVGVASLTDILQSNLPLAHFRQFFCSNLNLAAIGLMASHYSRTLRSVHIVDGFDQQVPVVYETDTDEDPFVMLAWKCSRLENITLIGYEVSDDDVVAIARLRGENLKQLNIPDSCIRWPYAEDEDVVGGIGQEFSSMISASLKRNWRPLLDFELPDAVFDDWADTETAYHSILLRDQHQRNSK